MTTQTEASANPKRLRLSTHRVAREDKIVCQQTGTIPEDGDMVFYTHDKSGNEMFFRTIKLAETWAKTHQDMLP